MLDDSLFGHYQISLHTASAHVKLWHIVPGNIIETQETVQEHPNPTGIDKQGDNEQSVAIQRVSSGLANKKEVERQLCSHMHWTPQCGDCCDSMRTENRPS